MIRKIIKGFLVILCMITIFNFSSDTGDESNEKSDGVIVKISELFVGHHLSPKEREEKIEKYVVLIRKSAHFTIYCLLGLLLISFLKEYSTLNTKILLLALLIAFLYACSDEIHQLLVPGRSGKVLDVVIDTLGSMTGIGIYYGIDKWRRKKHE